jgi:hypothetical protein
MSDTDLVTSPDGTRIAYEPGVRVSGLTLRIPPRTAPFRHRSICSRRLSVLRFALRMGSKPSVMSVERTANLELWPEEFQACADGNRIALTPREFEVLMRLVQHERHVVTRHALYEAVWGDAEMSNGYRGVDVHVYKVRTTLADAAPGWGVHPHASLGGLPIRSPATRVMSEHAGQP